MDSEMIKVKKGNMLSNLWNDIFKSKLDKLKIPRINMGFLGQHTNPARQQKNEVMKKFGWTGKQYRRHMKKIRRRIA